ncbi:IscS subfamily cysteine desulfurase [Marinobacter fonticola]|uniref:IscS subfamily cysteine desulfurase n=1 Tax=Marinobacter fonticola TaxID=2603215 RepID=UPI0011E6EE23|nr:IscS subfamily cysteine desulfurase [Marinobacter fonticola]
MKKPVYFDYAATTPVDPRVANRMVEHLTLDGVFGNPASRSHGYGWQAEATVEGARRQVADLIGSDPREIVWTSGATESDNLAIKGVASRFPGGHIVTSAIEHKAVLDTCSWLETQGMRVTYLAPDVNGRITVDRVEEALTEDTCLVSVMWVNNELGVTNDVPAIGSMLRNRGILFHVDAAQAAGKLPIDLSRVKVDLLSLSGHKVYGPKGIGALYVRRDPNVRIDAQIHGGGHERGMRSGTLATHQILGMGEAFRIAADELDIERERLFALRERFLAAVLSIEGVSLNGHPELTVPGIVNLSFEGVDGESLMLGLRELAVASGSACTSASLEPSYVLRALGVSDELAHSALRFSLGRFSNEEEIDFAASEIASVLGRLRELSRSRSGVR